MSSNSTRSPALSPVNDQQLALIRAMRSAIDRSTSNAADKHLRFNVLHVLMTMNPAYAAVDEAVCDAEEPTA